MKLPASDNLEPICCPACSARFELTELPSGKTLIPCSSCGVPNEYWLVADRLRVTNTAEPSQADAYWLPRPVKPFLYVSTVVRGATDREMTGFFYKVDWRKRRVLKKVPVPPTQAGLVGSRGGSRGGRGLAVFGGRLYASTFDKILVYNTELKLERSFSHPLVVGHHEIQVDAEGIWCCSTLIDAIIRLDHQGALLDACFLSEEPALLETGARFVKRDRNHNYLADVASDEAGGRMKEQFHVNTVTRYPSGEVHAFAHAKGHLIRIRPAVEVIETLPQLLMSHNVHVAGGRLFANNTKAHTFEVYDRREGLCGFSQKPTLRVDLDESGGSSQQLASAGWIRGMTWVSPDVVVVGTSPAALIFIDLSSGQVLDRMTLEHEVAHAVHGLVSAAM